MDLVELTNRSVALGQHGYELPRLPFPQCEDKVICPLLSFDKPKMVNAPGGTNQVFFRKVY